jgi:hypothetical protein
MPEYTATATATQLKSVGVVLAKVDAAFEKNWLTGHDYDVLAKVPINFLTSNLKIRSDIDTVQVII